MCIYFTYLTLSKKIASLRGSRIHYIFFVHFIYFLVNIFGQLDALKNNASWQGSRRRTHNNTQRTYIYVCMYFTCLILSKILRACKGVMRTHTTTHNNTQQHTTDTHVYMYIYFTCSILSKILRACEGVEYTNFFVYVFYLLNTLKHVVLCEYIQISMCAKNISLHTHRILPA